MPSSKYIWEEIRRTILKDLDHALDDLVDEFEEYADRQLREGDFSPEAKGKGAFNIGDLAGSVEKELNYLDKTIGYTSEYAPYVEFGTSPTWGAKKQTRKKPPREPIKQWTTEKLLIKEPKKLESVTEAIRYKISVVGTPPRPFMRRTVEHITHPATIEKILDKYFT